MKNSKKLLAYLIAAATIGATVNVSPSLYASADENECCCELPHVSQEEIDAYKEHFADKDQNSSSKIQQYSNQTLPSSVDLSTSPYFPPIGNQGGVGSCTAWATTYYQFTFAANKLNNITSTESTAYSPRWVYNWLNDGDISTGISFIDAYYLLEHQGGLTMADCPYMAGTQYDTSIPNNTEAMIRALKTKITNYDSIILNTEFCPITSPTDSDLNQIKGLLNSGHILQVNTHWNYNYKTTTGTTFPNEIAIYEFYHENGHAVSIVGYNDNIECDINGNGIIEEGERGAFKVANSHGKYSNNNGFVWVMYDALNTTSRYASNTNRTPAFYYYCELNENQFNYIEVENQPVNAVALLDINTSNIFNYIFETTKSYYTSYPSAEKYNIYDGAVAEYSIAKPFHGTLVFDYGEFDEPVSNFTSVLSNILGLHITKRSVTASTETLSKLTICDNNMNTIFASQNLPTIQNNNWFKCAQINLSKGDLNYDKSITNDDLNLLSEFLVDKITFSDLQFHLADMNGDSKVSIQDLIILNRQLPKEQQAAVIKNIKSMYNNMSIEEKTEYYDMFKEFENSMILDNNSIIE